MEVNTTCATALNDGQIFGIVTGILVNIIAILIALYLCHKAECTPSKICWTIIDSVTEGIDCHCNWNPHPPSPAHQSPILPPADSREPKQDTPGSRPRPSAFGPKAHVQAKDDSAPSDGAEQDQPLEQPPDPPCVPLSLSPSHPPPHHGTSSHESLPKKDFQCASSLSMQHNQPRESAVAPTRLEHYKPRQVQSLEDYVPPHVPSFAGDVSYDVKPAVPPKMKYLSVPSVSYSRRRDSAYARLSHGTTGPPASAATVEHSHHRSSLPSSSTQKKPHTTRDRQIKSLPGGVLMPATRRKEDKQPLLDEEKPDNKPVSEEECPDDLEEPAVPASEEQPASDPEQISDPVQKPPDESKEKDDHV